MVNENIGVGEFLKECLNKCADSLKHPLRFLPILVIGAVWLVIGYYSSKMELPIWAKVVSFLSFAEGGLFGGVLGALGGIVGKVVMAVFVNSAILPLFEKKWPFFGVAGGLKGMFSNIGINLAWNCSIFGRDGCSADAVLLHEHLSDYAQFDGWHSRGSDARAEHRKPRWIHFRAVVFHRQLADRRKGAQLPHHFKVADGNGGGICRGCRPEFRAFSMVPCHRATAAASRTIAQHLS